jgi:hypothetical protein
MRASLLRHMNTSSFWNCSMAPQSKLRINASMAWQAAMIKAKGEDYAMKARFNCDRSFDRLAHRQFTNIKITSITVGYDIFDLSRNCR